MLLAGNNQVWRCTIILTFLIKQFEEVLLDPIVNKHIITSTVKGLKLSSQEGYLSYQPINYSFNNATQVTYWPSEYVDISDTTRNLEYFEISGTTEIPDNIQISYTNKTSEYNDIFDFNRTSEDIEKPNTNRTSYFITTELADDIQLSYTNGTSEYNNIFGSNRTAEDIETPDTNRTSYFITTEIADDIQMTYTNRTSEYNNIFGSNRTSEDTEAPDTNKTSDFIITKSKDNIKISYTNRTSEYNEIFDSNRTVEDIESPDTNKPSDFIETSEELVTKAEITDSDAIVGYVPNNTSGESEAKTETNEFYTTVLMIKGDERGTSKKESDDVHQNTFMRTVYSVNSASDKFNKFQIHELVLLDEKVQSLQENLHTKLNYFTSTLNYSVGEDIMNETVNYINNVQEFLETFEIFKESTEKNNPNLELSLENFTFPDIGAYKISLNENENIQNVLEKIFTLIEMIRDVFQLHEEIKARAEEYNKGHDVDILDKNVKEKYNEIDQYKNISETSRSLADFVSLHKLDEIFQEGAGTVFILNYTKWQRDYHMLNQEMKSDERILHELKSINILEYRVIPTIHVMIFIIGIIANGILLLIFIKHKEMRTAPNLMLINLAFGEFLSLIVSIPTSYAYYSLSGKTDDASCKSYYFFRYQGIGVSAYSLVSISIQRFLAMNQFFNSSKYKMGKWLKSFLYLLSSWIVGSIIALPFTLYAGAVNGSCYLANPDKDVEYRKMTTLLSLIAFCIVPVILNATFSGLTATKLRQSALQFPGESIGKERVVRARVLSYRVIVVLLSIFTFCYTPYFLFNFVYSWATIHVEEVAYRYMVTIFYSLIFFHSSLNPISLYIVSRKYRAYFNRYLFCNKTCDVNLCPTDKSATTSTTTLDTNL